MASTLSTPTATGGLPKLKHEYTLLKKRYEYLNRLVQRQLKLQPHRTSIHLTEQRILKQHLKRLENYIRRINNYDALSFTVPSEVGKHVSYEMNGATHDVVLVDPADADPFAGRISIQSPIGQALSHCHIGQTVNVITPRGEKHLHILKAA